MLLGGYGYIWKVRDTRNGQYYALKRMMCVRTVQLTTLALFLAS